MRKARASTIGVEGMSVAELERVIERKKDVVNKRFKYEAQTFLVKSCAAMPALARVAPAKLRNATIGLAWDGTLLPGGLLDTLTPEQIALLDPLYHAHAKRAMAIVETWAKTVPAGREPTMSYRAQLISMIAAGMYEVEMAVADEPLPGEACSR